MSLSAFSKSIQIWFSERIGTPTGIQSDAWPAVSRGDHVLISAPTGAGKSLAAWVPLIDRLLSRPVRSRSVSVLYVSPLRALSRDMAKGMLDLLNHSALQSLRPDTLSIAVRTGDTSPAERAHQRRQPPEVLLTTPESLFVLLGSSGGRHMLSGVETIVIDEIHALTEDKRGSHLALSVERLNALVGGSLQRIGLSATARPLQRVARYLCGKDATATIVDSGSPGLPRVHLECPPWPIGHLAGPMHWDFINERLLALARRSGTLLIFCNTRAMVERLGHQLAEQLGEDRVASHHGSLGIERRRWVERGLKSGMIQVVVCTASLELGIDVGPLDRVCQIAMCQSINAFRQRAGRARHRPGEVGEIHVFPLSLTDLLDFEAVRQSLRREAMDEASLRPPDLDVLAQQLIAMVSTGLDRVERLFELVTRASSFSTLERRSFDQVLEMLHEGYVPGRETGQGPIVRIDPDQLQAVPKADKLSLVNSGTIPEWFEYDVVDERGRRLGRLDEEFAFESSPGQVLSLGGQSWRILRVRTGQVEVESCDDEAPNLPFWFGDGAGRSSALSQQVQARCASGLSDHASLSDWLNTARAQLGHLPDAERVVFERFYDPGGDQHLVIHSLFGARLNRAWGLALRKRFCRNFNFELQAAATDNGVLISLGAVHSFQLESVRDWLKSDQLTDVLTQAMLDTPIFQTRLRWCANTALAVARRDLRGKIPAQIQRNQTENFIARVFPDQLACLENLSGHREVPDHPLVAQALRDCLDQHLDLPGLIRIYEGLEQGRIHVHCVDREQPSALAEALIHAPRNSFLDPAAAEERRTRTFEQRGRTRGAQATLATGQNDFSSAEGLLQGLLRYGFLTAREGERHRAGTAFTQLLRECRVASVKLDHGTVLWVAMERLGQFTSVWPRAIIAPFISSGLRPASMGDPDDALSQILLGRVRLAGQVDIQALNTLLGLGDRRLIAALSRLKAEGLLESRQDATNWRERKPETVG